MGTSENALDLLEQDIAERLAPVCGNMTREAFRDLVHDIAMVKIKYGVESLASEELHGPIVDAVVVARVEVREDQSPDTAA
jgi:hypothetical protein